ncbi:ferrioxamine receptor [Klebsiella pneumoniae]|nr:ferrioxamine receptor [Klebsiella pneumoniae]
MPCGCTPLHHASRRDGGGHCHPAGVRQRADGGLQRQHLARGDENRPTVNHYRPVGVGGHPPADGGSGGEYHQPGAGIYPGVYSSFGGGATRFDAISLRGYHGGDVDNLFLDGMRLMSDGGSHNVCKSTRVYRTRGCDPRPLLRALRAERAGRRGQPDFQTSAVQSAGPHPPDRRHAKIPKARPSITPTPSMTSGHGG